ncbi:MAG: wax ester/triacylglycerol synthase family O-acyltransferase [Proteobacteria bacterium]|nr:wax ester/triacylglycerol synthase family O-acyltransferase [Pseudomonadota bacterium]
MSTRDAGFLYLERPHSLLHIGCLAIVDGELTRSSLIRKLESRLPRTPRYTQRALNVPFSLGHPTWETDPQFDLRRHVHRWALPSPGGLSELHDLVTELWCRPLDRHRPLWDMHVIEGLDGDRTAVFQKVHHCMIDGIAGAQLLEELLDPTPEIGSPTSPPRAREPELPTPTVRAGRALAEGLGSRLRQAAGLLGSVAQPARARANLEDLRRAAFSAVRLATGDVPTCPWNHPLGPHRALAFTRLPMLGVRVIRRELGGTVNDVVLCVLAGGLHRYLNGCGISTRGLELSAMVPVSLRSADAAAELGNRISAMLVPLAVDLESDTARLTATRGITEQLKKDGAWTGIDALLSIIENLPPPVVAAVAGRMPLGRLANVIATNVPGPRETRFLAGRRVEALYPLVPIADGMGLGLAVFSYDGWLHVGLTADADRVPDLDKLRRGIEDAFSSLAGSLPSQ